MKNLSWWAWCHPRKAKALAILLNILLILLGIFFGVGAYFDFGAVPLITINLLSGMVLLLVYIHPKRKRKLNRERRNQFYCNRIKNTFGIYSLLFCLSFSFGSRLPVLVENVPTEITTAYGVSKKMERQSKRLAKKDLKRQLKAKIKEMRKRDGLSPGWKFTLLLLAAILAFIGALALAALSCALSCAGNGIGAAAAAIAGAGAITGGVFLIIAGVKALRTRD